ncbi:glycosyltransferase family 4 protein [Symbiobacterium thermophilum]|uniref:glycosyltransferase family 4 protein n=1 Tax=Symbiobacterium thermophilum TaxID=2734 RepID=UPI0035C6F1DF
MSARLAIVSTYPPRQCGLATFSAHLRGGLLAAGAEDVAVAAMVKRDAPAEQLPETVTVIRDDLEIDYRRAAHLLNHGGYDAVLLQHEFGIFGGQAGVMVNHLLDRLEIPVIATLHTILSDPEPEYRHAMTALLQRIDAAVVMARRGGEIIQQVYGADPERIAYIPHGVPAPPPGTPAEWKNRLGLSGRTVVMTFGLLGPGKGIETALQAVALASRGCPDLLYLVVGATHPEVLRREGERYRQGLEAQVAELGIQGHVRFVNRYLDEDELLGFLQAADIYLVPYPGAQQISSGTLTYALAMGKPIISTPFVYAQELLGEGAGLLVPFHDAAAMGRALSALAADAGWRTSLSAAARNRAKGFTWPEVGQSYLDLVGRLQRRAARAQGGALSVRVRQRPGGTREKALPRPRLSHLQRLTDPTGVIQHAVGPIPNLTTGYTSDDNARALLVSVWAARAGEATAQLSETYLAFLAYAQRPDGWFHNAFSYDRNPLAEDRSEDCQARCLWGLAAAATQLGGSSVAWTAAHLFRRGLAPCGSIRTLRGRAGVAVAMAEWLEHRRADGRPDGAPTDDEVRAHLIRAADGLTDAWKQHATRDWAWFEDRLTYDNALLPYALLRAGRILDVPEYRRIGLTALEFLAGATFRDGVFWPIGNDGWYVRGGRRAEFDQQPLEATAMVLACQEAGAVTGDKVWHGMALDAARWFTGRNALGVPLLDPETGGCHDGLNPHGVNRNQGAESTLAWLMVAYGLEQRSALSTAVR